MRAQRRTNFTRAILCRNLQGKCQTPIPGHGILCEPAQSKRTWTFHKSHFVWKFTGKNAAPASAHLDQTPGLNTHRKNPFSAATLFGVKKE